MSDPDLKVVGGTQVRGLGPAPPPDTPRALAIARLSDLAFNLWWCWHPEVLQLFQDLDPSGWRAANHNPVQLLKQIDNLPERIDLLSLESRINFQHRRLQEYLRDPDTWASEQGGTIRANPIAYFSAEFGLHESLPLYSGGLGVLAGDYLKSTSDLGVPVIGVGLFYALGYFRQRLDGSGWQQQEYGATDIDNLPLVRAVTVGGEPLGFHVHLGRERLEAVVWIAQVGRNQLLLLDSDMPANPPHLRTLTSRLYGGDQVTRIRQEILLGIGGLRALRRLGIAPRVLHLNEGHSAFAIFERMRQRIAEDGFGFADALAETAIQTVFTTHTPVEAGHDRFSAELMEDQLGWMRQALGVDHESFLGLGRVDVRNSRESFCMTVLGLKGSRRRNGVSALNGHVVRRMWQAVWPQKSEAEVPIGHITNGVHTRSWLAPAMGRLYERYLGAEWWMRQREPATWRGIAHVDPAELWETHAELRRRLIAFVRRRTGSRTALAPDVLTVGFARRFATYKRATLLLADTDRLARLCSRAGGGLQIVIAGKAHPRDDAGKGLIRDVIQLARDSRLAGRIAFVEDYDINVARHLVQGVDLWINTPQRPLEACGTSGQKVVLNGGLNCSILDGWWAEAYDGHNGFAVGAGDTHRDPAVQWTRDLEGLYGTLESQVLPAFYRTDDSGVPVQWVERMKRSILTLAWRYNAERMVVDYVTHTYLPASGGLSTDMA